MNDKSQHHTLNVAFFNAKEYDIKSFENIKRSKWANQNSEDNKYTFNIKYFEAKLDPHTAQLAKGYDVACAFVNDDLSAKTIDALYEAEVKVLAMRCAGYNNIDVRHAYKKIHIVRVPSYSPYAIAEHAMGMLLTSIRKIHKAYNRTRDFNFNLSGLTGFELHNKTVGIVGTGKIGMIFADICKGFGMDIIAYDKYPRKNTNIKYVKLDEVYKNSDVISLHCPLTEQNHHMIDKSAINQMKPGVILINTSRGGLVDAASLIEGIKDKKIGAACLDVYEEESDIFYQDFSSHIVSDDILARLISMPNVLITSHQAYLTHEALKNIANTTLHNIIEIISKGKCENEVCYKCDKFPNCTRGKIQKCF